MLYLVAVPVFFLLPQQTRAQWIVTLQTPPGYDLYLEHLWWVDIVNQETRPVQVFLFGEVFEESKGNMFHGRSNVLTIPPGGRRITSADVTQVIDEWYNPEFKRAIERTGRFPAGKYILCVTVSAAEEPRPLGVNCVRHGVTMPSAPRLIMPAEESEVTETYPIFQWTAPTPVPPEAQVVYHIKVCEIFRRQTSQDAINNIAHFEVTNYDMTSLQYPIRAKAFENGKEYAWQVQATDERGTPLGENEGKSEIWKFKFNPLPPLPDTLVMGGFKLAVKEYGQVSPYILSGRAEGQFFTYYCYSDALNPLVPSPSPGLVKIIGILSTTSFTVEFKGLEVGGWPPKKTETVTKGKIEQTFGTPLRCPVADFTVNITKLIIEPDTAQAEVFVQLPPAAITKPSGCTLASIEVGLVGIDGTCSIYKDLPNYSIDSLLIGNTGMLISVRGVEVDLQSSTKKVVFKAGETILQKSTAPNNTGYLLCEYTFSNGEVVGCEGFKAELMLKQACEYKSLTPLDFHLDLKSGNLHIEKSWVKSGKFTGRITLPKAVKDSKGDNIVASLVSSTVDPQLNFSGKVAFARNQELRWGGFGLVTDSANLFLPSTSGEFFVTPLDTVPYAVNDTVRYKQIIRDSTIAALKTVPGLTLNLFYHPANDTFAVYTPDTKTPLRFDLYKKALLGWLNITTKGITGELQSEEKLKLIDKVKYGVDDMGNESDSSFTASIEHKPDSLLWVNVQFIRNAVFDSYISGHLTIPYPCDFIANYKNLEVSSTAELVGGEVFFKEKELQYWGVLMTAEQKGNILSVDNKEIVYLNSSIKEPIHFAKPFRIIWGEMYGNGQLGKFLFDYNSAGQRFDGFPFTLHAASLSQYFPNKPKTGDTLGYLRAYGDVHFDFFGAKRVDIHDYKDARQSHDKDPYYGRFVILDKDSSNLHFDKNWGTGTARMVFDADYDVKDQNGFQGITTKKAMTVDLQFLSSMKAGTLTAKTIDLNSNTSFIYFCSGGSLNVLDNQLADVKTIGGIIQIKGDAIKRICLEGHIESKFWKFDTHTMTSLEITPNNTTITHRGQLTFTFFGAGLLGLTSTKMILDKTNQSLDGDISGVFRVYSGTNFTVVQADDYMGLEARGRFNFHIGSDANYFQGYGKIAIKWKTALECEGAFFVGYKAPTEKIWALDQITRGPSIRTILSNQGTSELTGFYFAGSFGYTLSLWGIIEGGYTIWAGVGFFGEPPTAQTAMPSATFLGHAGLEIHGAVLGGLATASAWAELLADTKISSDFHICLMGTLGVKACIIHLCASWQGTIHIDDETGIGTGACYEQ